jgi:hypothetical protein
MMHRKPARKLVIFIESRRTWEDRVKVKVKVISQPKDGVQHIP